MIVGDPSRIAIESQMLRAIDSVGQQALGFFVVHIGGREYGIRAPDATMMGCSLQGVSSRLAARGTHVSEALARTPAAQIAAAYISIFYDTGGHSFADLREEDFLKSNARWCPDGDEAFDDGSNILQLDLGGKVRIIAFKNNEYQVDNLVEQYLDADEFYSTLQKWHRDFQAERKVVLSTYIS